MQARHADDGRKAGSEAAAQRSPDKDEQHASTVNTEPITTSAPDGAAQAVSFDRKPNHLKQQQLEAMTA